MIDEQATTMRLHRGLQRKYSSIIVGLRPNSTWFSTSLKMPEFVIVQSIGCSYRFDAEKAIIGYRQECQLCV